MIMDEQQEAAECESLLKHCPDEKSLSNCLLRKGHRYKVALVLLP